MQFYETRLFKKAVEKILDEESQLELYGALAEDPSQGDVIPGTGGLRKLRWKRPGMGKRGGARVIYYFYP